MPMAKVITEREDGSGITGGSGLLQTDPLVPAEGQTDAAAPLLTLEAGTTKIEIQPPEDDDVPADEEEKEQLIQNGSSSEAAAAPAVEAVVEQPAKKRSVRLRTKSQDEFLLPPLARQETEEGLGISEAGGAGAGSGLLTADGPPPVSPRSIAQGMASAFSIVRKVSQRVSNKKQGKTQATVSNKMRVYK